MQLFFFPILKYNSLQKILLCNLAASWGTVSPQMHTIYGGTVFVFSLTSLSDEIIHSIFRANNPLFRPHQQIIYNPTSTLNFFIPEPSKTSSHLQTRPVRNLFFPPPSTRALTITWPTHMLMTFILSFKHDGRSRPGHVKTSVLGSAGNLDWACLGRLGDVRRRGDGRLEWGGGGLYFSFDLIQVCWTPHTRW